MSGKISEVRNNFHSLLVIINARKEVEACKKVVTKSEPLSMHIWLYPGQLFPDTTYNV